MDSNGIIAMIDGEISRLQQAKMLLNDGGSTAPVPARRGPGRPPKTSKNGLTVMASTETGSGARNVRKPLSPAARKRISQAVKERWAKQRKATAGKAA